MLTDDEVRDAVLMAKGIIAGAKDGGYNDLQIALALTLAYVACGMQHDESPKQLADTIREVATNLAKNRENFLKIFGIRR